ncbi:hypothetical protein ACWCQ0_54335, partial [Streptomyces massasporeus]
MPPSTSTTGTTAVGTTAGDATASDATATGAAGTTTPPRPRALFAMGRRHRDALFPASETARLRAYVDLDPDHVVEDFSRAPGLETVELLITSWGCPPLDADVLDRAPALRAVVHAAGSVKHHVTQACWDRGLAVTS